MKWTSHRLITTAAVFALTIKPVPCVFAYIGSTMPDAFEFSLPSTSPKHRTHSHWWVYYAAAALISYCVMSFYKIDICSPFTAGIMRYYQRGWPNAIAAAALIHPPVFWLCVGSLFHLAEDIVTAPIPIWSPTKKVKIMRRWFYMGSKKEYYFACAVCAVFLLIGLIRCGYLSDGLPHDLAQMKSSLLALIARWR